MSSSTSYGGSESWSVWSGFSSADGGFVKVRSGIERAAGAGVRGARDPVDERLRDVADHREAARHVAVERAVADRELALVAGREDEAARVVRERHQDLPAHARLHVLLGEVAERACPRTPRAARGRRRASARSGSPGSGSPRFRASAAASSREWLRAVARGHRDAEDRGRAERLRRDAGGEGGVDAAGEPDDRACGSRTCARSRARRARAPRAPRRRAGPPPRARAAASAAPSSPSTRGSPPSRSATTSASSKSGARARTAPSAPTSIEPPSKTSASFPPTWFT